jgi:hypothetical protein
MLVKDEEAVRRVVRVAARRGGVARNVGARRGEHACHIAICVESCRGRGLAVPARLPKHNVPTMTRRTRNVHKARGAPRGVHMSNRDLQ